MLHLVKGPHSKFSAVFINGQFMGHVGEYDNSLQGQLIKPGEYEVKVVSPEGKGYPRGEDFGQSRPDHHGSFGQLIRSRHND
jgi:hypothetical protein